MRFNLLKMKNKLHLNFTNLKFLHSNSGFDVGYSFKTVKLLLIANSSSLQALQSALCNVNEHILTANNTRDPQETQTSQQKHSHNSKLLNFESTFSYNSRRKLKDYVYLSNYVVNTSLSGLLSYNFNMGLEKNSRVIIQFICVIIFNHINQTIHQTCRNEVCSVRWEKIFIPVIQYVNLRTILFFYRLLYYKNIL